MKWPFFFKRSAVDDDRLDRYKRLRQVGRDLNVTLAKRLPKDAVPECGKKLGISKGGTLILHNDDDIAVLYDYCLYHHRRGNKNVIERYLEQSPPASDTDEATLLRAMLTPRFSAFRIQQIKPRQGAVLLDLVRGDTLDLVDIDIAGTGNVNAVLIGRLLSLADFHMSTGTLMPLAEEDYVERIEPIIKQFMPNRDASSQPAMSAAQEASYVGRLIRETRRVGGADNVFHTDIGHAG